MMLRVGIVLYPGFQVINLAVVSVFAVLTISIRFFAASATSVALTFEPAIVTLPLPGVLLPVAVKLAVLPARTFEPICEVVSSLKVSLLSLVPKLN